MFILVYSSHGAMLILWKLKVKESSETYGPEMIDQLCP
jgi:hypothetical protein